MGTRVTQVYRWRSGFRARDGDTGETRNTGRRDVEWSDGAEREPELDPEGEKGEGRAKGWK